MAFDPSQAGHGLVAGRALFGVTGLVAPRRMLRSLGVKGTDPDFPYVTRLLASRELVLAALAGGAAGPEAAKGTHKVGIAVDALDVVSLWIAWKKGRVTTGNLVWLTAAGVAAVAAGIVAAGSEPSRGACPELASMAVFGARTAI